MRSTSLGLAIALLIATGCSDELAITNPNNPTQEGAATNVRDAISRQTVGVIATYRGNRGASINGLGSYGRETYNMTLTDGRSVTGPYRDWRQNNAFTSGQEWGRYGNYRNIYEALKANENAGEALTDAEKAGVRGVLNTFLALDVLHIIEARGAIGAVIDMSDDVNEIFPIETEETVYQWISAKLDEANTDLGQAGGTFFFPMNAGFSAFGVAANTPAGFVRFNRGLKARVEAKRGSIGCGAACYTAALAALSGSFLAELTTANRDIGVYSIFSTAAGDALNGTSFAQNANLFVHPLIDQIAGVAADDRYRRKVDTREASGAENDLCAAAYTARTVGGATATNRPCTYAANIAPIQTIRNEELILIRAEARWFTGDQAGARADLAAVRASSGASNGGTPVSAFANPASNPEFVTELLLQRTLSLFQEGHRFADYRRFGRLAELGTLPQDIAAGFTVAPYSVLPQLECDARLRAGNPGGIPRTCPGGEP